MGRVERRQLERRLIARLERAPSSRGEGQLDSARYQQGLGDFGWRGVGVVTRVQWAGPERRNRQGCGPDGRRAYHH